MIVQHRIALDTAAYLTACAEDLAGRLFALEGGGTVWL